MMNASLFSRTAPTAAATMAADDHRALRAEPVDLAQQLDLAFRFVAQHVVSLPDPYACCVLFFTVAAEALPVSSFSIRRVTLHAAWREGATRVRQWAWAHNASGVELRIDWACGIQPVTPQQSQLRTADPTRTWALADDELEYTELLTALGKNTSRNLAEVQSLCDPVPVTTHARWQLLLEGVYIDQQGELTALPRPRLSPSHLRHGPAGPMLYRATQQLLAQHQSDDGSWPEAGTLLDHLGITYALLLAHKNTQMESLKDDAGTRACHRAIAYLIEQMRRWSLHDYASEMLHAMSLIVLVRYTEQFPGAIASSTVSNLITLLSQQLGGVSPALPGDTPPWGGLSLEALRQRQQQSAPDELLPSQGSNRSYDGKWLHASWPQLRLIADDGGRPSPAAQPWTAVAVMECALRQGQPQFMSDGIQAQFKANMQTLFRACYQRIVWPEVALFQASNHRKQAAFFSPRSSNALVSDCRIASQLLITINAAMHFASA